MKQIIIAIIFFTLIGCKNESVEPTKGNPYAGQSQYIKMNVEGEARSCQNISFIIDTVKIVGNGNIKIIQGEPLGLFYISKIDYQNIHQLNISIQLNDGEQFNQIKDSCSLAVDNYENYYHGVFSGYLRSDKDPNRILHIEDGEFLGIKP